MSNPTGAPSTTPNATFPGGPFFCGPSGGTQTSQIVNFSAQGTVPLNFVLAATAPQLPTSLFQSLGGTETPATQELDEFIHLSGTTLTISINSVPVGTGNSPLTNLGLTPAVAPPGTLVNQLRVQVNNIILTDGPNGTMEIDGIVMAPSSTSTGGTGGTGGTGTGGTTTGSVSAGPGLVPNLFGDLTGRAVTVSMGFNGPLAFPGLGVLGSGTGVTGLPSTMVVSMLSVQVAGQFTVAAPVGFAVFRVPPAAFSSVGTGGTGGTTPGTGTPTNPGTGTPTTPTNPGGGTGGGTGGGGGGD